MITALAWVLLQATPVALRAEVSAPAQVQVGAPFELTVELRHGAGAPPRLLADAVGEGWVVLSEDGAVTLRDEAAGAGTTRVRWTVCALEPMEDALPALMAVLPDDSVQAPYVEPGGGGIDVLGVLGPDEDTARAPRGFREDAPPAESAPWWLLALAGLPLAALALWLARRRSTPVQEAQGPDPLERLAAIEPGALTSSDEIRAAHYEITAAVRAGLDARQGVARDGLTDEEWVAAVEPAGGARREALEELFTACAAVKYAGARPTHWAIAETVERARAVRASDPAPEPAAVAGGLDGQRPAGGVR